jgi:hypothetical protein
VNSSLNHGGDHGHVLLGHADPVLVLHGFIVQRTAFGLDDPAGFTRDVRTVLSDAGVLIDPPASGA